MPIKDNSKSKKIWLGIKYTNSIINHQSKLIEEKKGKELYIESNENFYEFSKTDIKYLKLLPASEDKSGFINAITKQIY